MIVYLTIATPHKHALTEHYLKFHLGADKSLYIWHDRMRALMLSGSIKNTYYLLISYYGYWFLPRFLLDIIKSELLKGRKGCLKVLSLFVGFLLFVRANPTLSFPMRVLYTLRSLGLKLFFQKVRLKLFKKLFEKTDRSTCLQKQH